MVTQAAIGFDQKKPPSRTAVVALVISKGFDSVDHTILLQQISDSALHSNLVRWLAVYFHGHSAACIYQSARFALMIIHSWTPQGGVLLPAIFNHFVSVKPDTASLSESYADNITAGETSP
jgi:hypothetical protein